MKYINFLNSPDIHLEIKPIDLQGKIITYRRENSDEVIIHFNDEKLGKIIVEIHGQPYVDNFIADYKENSENLYKIKACQEVRRRGFEFFGVACVYDLPSSNNYQCKIEIIKND